MTVRADGHKCSRIQHMNDVAFVAPDIVENIANGTQPFGFTSELVKRHDLPTNWQEQRDFLGRL